MTRLMTKFGMMLATLTLGLVSVLAQDGATVVTPHSEAASGLDLYAVAELFKHSETLEKFEQSLNHSETGINNLDLDQNGEVDLTLDGKKGAIIISGPRTAVKVKEEKLYENTLTLVKELYRIMNSQDKSVLFEEAELIREPITR